MIRLAALLLTAAVASAQPCTPCLSPCPLSACDAYLKRQAIESGFCGGEPCNAVSANSVILNSSGTAVADGADGVGRISTMNQQAPPSTTTLRSRATTNTLAVSRETPPDCSFVKFSVDAADPHAITSADMAKALDWSGWPALRGGAGLWFACRPDLPRDYRVYVLSLPPGVAAKHPIDYFFDRGFEFLNETCEFTRIATQGYIEGVPLSWCYGDDWCFTDTLTPTLNDSDLHSAAIINHEVVVHFRAPCQWRAFTYRWN